MNITLQNILPGAYSYGKSHSASSISVQSVLEQSPLFSSFVKLSTKQKNIKFPSTNYKETKLKINRKEMSALSSKKFYLCKQVC